MVVGILTVVLFFEGSDSLKKKRMILHSLKARLRNAFNVSVTQVADEDKWQKATLAVVGVARQRQEINRELSEAVNFIERFEGAVIIDYATEFI